MNIYQKSSPYGRLQLRVGLYTVLVIIMTASYILSPTAAVETYNSATDLSVGAEIADAGVAEVWIPELPVRLVIPALGIDAPVQYVGLDVGGSGEMGVPSNFADVGWYKHGVRPGMDGSAVMAGHLNGRGVPEAVFYDLHTLERGDEVVVHSADRIEDIFVVVRVETYPYDEPTDEVFISSDGVARLNLITCGGSWLSEIGVYDTRTVVFTEQRTDVE